MSLTRKPKDDLLLFHGLMVIIYGDGILEDRGQEALLSFLTTLPDFQDKDPFHLVEESSKILRKYSSIQESIQELEGLSTMALKKRCFVLAADFALASGNADQSETDLLETMRRVMQIPDDFAHSVMGCLIVKYAS